MSSDWRVASLPMTFTKVRIRAPPAFAASIAPSVSAVSPDCVIAIASWPSETTG